LLACYNRRAYFREALDSVLGQTYRDFHVLVIDDASDDGTAELARDYEARSNGRVTVICKPTRRGYVHSVNLGLNLLASASNVAFHNDDDVWHPEKLERQMQVLADHPELGMVATEAAIIDEHGHRTGRLFSDLNGKLDLEHPARHLFWFGNCLCAPSVIATRTALDLVEPYEIADGGCNDMHMWLAISARLPVAWIEEPLTDYRQSSGQMSSVRVTQMFREMFELRERAFNRSEELRDAVGAEAGETRLGGDALYWAAWHLRRFDWSSYVWFSRNVIARRRPRQIVLLAYLTARSLVEGMVDAVRGRVRHAPQ
jgi:glycosyltransferase involved in cell wall biosynthesis